MPSAAGTTHRKLNRADFRDMRKGYRRTGDMSSLIDAAVEFARTADAPAVEAYPLDGAVSPSATSMGYASVFAAAGFVEIARRSPERPIMRLTLP